LYIDKVSKGQLDFQIGMGEKKMIFDRNYLENMEDQFLAPYGIRSKDTRGRAYPEDERGYRTAFQRDRDRILHTTAFRRLEYKTQVFIVTEGDYYRTRLTHTLEVSQIGRTIARALGANEDLVESICLSHDLGHPPFGHAGESILHDLMQDHGGFDHNKQSYRIVTELEKRYPEFPGLNLTWEVREGIVKHETEYDVSDAVDYSPEKRGHLEAQISNGADELAYTAHDLDDGLRSGMIQPSQLNGLELWDELVESVGWKQSEVTELARHQIIRRFIGMEVSDLIHNTDFNLKKHHVLSVEQLQLLDENVVSFSSTMITKNRQLKDFLYANLYRHPRVVRMQTKAETCLSDIFNAYIKYPEILPLSIQKSVADGDFYRSICDYLAGMTDRYALQEHSKLFDLQTKP
jgi:dGTPase